MIMEKGVRQIPFADGVCESSVPDIAARGRLGNGFNDHVNTSEYV